MAKVINGRIPSIKYNSLETKLHTIGCREDKKCYGKHQWEFVLVEHPNFMDNKFSTITQMN